MKKQNIAIFFLFSVLLFSSCSNFLKEDSKTVFDLQGLWKSEGNILLFEEWLLKADSSLVGRGFSVNGSDTVIFERIRIAKKDGKLTYFANVSDQNQGKEIAFPLDKVDFNKWVFENPEHDYPNRIIYTFTSDSTFTSRIENMRGNKQKEFRFKKISL
ncbi:MAG: hypothetical protein KG029_17360 [Bacteroidetes bacterium]|nr:hypothetical protein [Bacteroidota bacterium]